MDEPQLKAVLASYRENAIGNEEGGLASIRKNALEHYHGKPYGDEIEGRSQIVTRDLSEAVDAVLAPCLKTIFQSGNPVEFTPRGPEDVALAEQETDYTNYVIMNRNPGFLVLHDAIKDALVLKNGYIFYWWDESKSSKEERYAGLTQADEDKLLSELENDDDVIEFQIKERETEVVVIEGTEVNVSNFKLRVLEKKSQVVFEAFPTEEVTVANTARGAAKDADFIEHETIKTRSDLIEMGVDKDWLEERSADGEISDAQSRARSQVTEEDEDTDIADPSMTEHTFRSAYVRVDFDDDGVAELRRVIQVDDDIPPGDEWNMAVDDVQVASFSMKRIPHRHLGESLDDALSDLQRINTVLHRQMLDNIYLTNWNQWVVNDNVELTDFLTHTASGVKRTNSTTPVQNDAMQLPVQPVAHQILPIMDRVEQDKAKRTGVGQITDGTLNPDVLKETAVGTMDMQLSRAMEKIEFYIRMLIETGLKDLVLGIHKLLRQYQDKPDVVKLRGTFVEIDPRGWKDRTELKAKVGLGHGSRQEKLQNLTVTIPVLERLQQFGMVGPNQAFNFWEDFSEQMGYVNPERYVMNPQSREFQQAAQARAQQPDPVQQQIQGALQAEQIKTQGSLQEAQIKAQTTLTQEQMRAQRDKIKADAELQKFLAQFGLDVAQLEIDAFEVGINANNVNTVADLGGKQGAGV